LLPGSAKLLVLHLKLDLIEPGSPRENGYIESFSGRLRDELLNGKIFTALLKPGC
jgi:hypothetical protein